MLDERCMVLLKIINGECVGTGYKIFALEDLALSLPRRFLADKEEVSKLLINLCEREYISVKYQDEIEVCVCTLPKGRTVFERAVESEIENSRVEKRYFLWAFLGGVSGGLVSALIVALTLVLGG
ncbi:MAG: hypothetical protein J6U92_07205 [Clostridia bacterium]|nr:hypothetical protein [Clostridia bacterium]